VATITKTPSKTWKAIVRKRGWPTTIKTFRTKRDAEDWARSTEDEMVRGVYIDRSNAIQLLLKKALDRYMQEVSATKKSSTHTAEKHKAKALKAELGAYSMAAINPGLVAKYRDDRLAAGKSADTVRLELSLLSHLFTIAIKEWRLGLIYNPVMNIRKPPPGQGRNRRLSADEETKLLEACDNYSNPMLGWIVRTAILTGMRAGEITSLRRDQIDLERRVVRLTDTKNGSARTVPLCKEAKKILRMALDNPVRPIDTDYVFWGEPGRDRKRRPYEFRMAWKKIIKDTQIDNLRFHDLRHEAVSRLIEAGLGDQEVASISGHKSMQMLKRYTHLRAEDLVERLDQVMGRR
jgi:integrase